MPSDDETLFDQVLDKNADVWTQIGKDSADTGKGLWNTAQLPFDAIEQGVKLGFDPAAREKVWNSAIDEAGRLSKLADSADEYGKSAWRDPMKVYGDARDGVQGFVTDQVVAENQEGSKYWTDAIADSVFGVVTMLVGGTALQADKTAAKVTADGVGNLGKVNEAVSSASACPASRPTDWVNLNVNGVTPFDVLPGDPNKVAIIGRSMRPIEDFVAGLPPGVMNPEAKIEKFSSPEAMKELKFVGNGSMLYEPDGITDTRMFRDNLDWAKKLKSEGYTVIDLGNPEGEPELSPFYNMERSTIFGDKLDLSPPGYKGLD